jgi:FdhE protein
VTDAPALPGAIRPIRLPDPALLFRARADRLAALAPGSPAEGYLLLLSRIARGQLRAVREIAVPAIPRGGARPIAPSRLPREAAWRRMLGVVLAEAKQPGLPAEALFAIRRLEDDGVTALDRLADAVLAGRLGPEVAPDALATAPFVGAALQAWFAANAAAVDLAGVEPAQGGCPLCGAPPVAGIVLGDDRLRYLACSLCGAEWHLARVHCASCRDNAALSYFSIEGERGVQAEACEACHTYVKLFDLRDRPGAEPLADDAATIPLDLLVAEEGYARGGVNVLLWVDDGAYPA